MRHEDSPELFGGGCGVSTVGNITCGFCLTDYTDREDPNDPSGGFSDVSIAHTDFAGLQVCDCCYERIEQEILYRIHDILIWYGKILDRQKRTLVANEDALADVEKRIR